MTTRLQALGYTEVFSEKRDDISYELRQHDLAVERERAKIERERVGWCYKIMYKESGEESQVFGPFT